MDMINRSPVQVTSVLLVATIGLVILCLSLIETAQALELGEKQSSRFSKYKEAQRLFRENKLDESLKILRKMNEDPDPESLRLMGEVYLKQKQDAQAVRTFEQLTTLRPEDYRGWKALGQGLYLVKKKDPAISAYRNSLKLNSSYKPAYLALLEIFKTEKMNFERRSLLETMLERFDSDPEVYSWACQAHAEENFFDKGMSICKTATELDSKNADNFVYLGLMEKGKYGQTNGIERLRMAAKKFQNSHFAQVSAAKISEELKNWEATSKYYRQAVVVRKEDGESLLGIALAEFELMNYEDSLQYFLKACVVERKAQRELIRATGRLGVLKEEKWYSKYRKSQESCQSKFKP